MEMIANKLFDKFVELMENKVHLPHTHSHTHSHTYTHTLTHSQPANADRLRELETVAQLLLFKFNHLRGRIKQLADRYLSKLVEK